MKKLDLTLDWTGLVFLGGNCFLRVGGWGGGVVIFFLVCKKITFSTFPQRAIFFPLGRRGGGEGVVDFFTLLCCLLVLFYVCHF